MGQFVMRQVSSGVKFDLLAGNGQVIATSEVYRTAAACRKGIESVRKYAPTAGDGGNQRPSDTDSPVGTVLLIVFAVAVAGAGGFFGLRIIQKKKKAS